MDKMIAMLINMMSMMVMIMMNTMSMHDNDDARDEDGEHDDKRSEHDEHDDEPSTYFLDDLSGLLSSRPLMGTRSSLTRDHSSTRPSAPTEHSR